MRRAWWPIGNAADEDRNAAEPAKDSKGKAKARARYNGMALMARSPNYCLVEITTSRDSDHLLEFLGDFEGTIDQDSYTGWFKVGKNRQMCPIHQIRLVKKDLKYKNPKGDVRKFLLKLKRILKDLYAAHVLVTDKHERLAKVDEFDAKLKELMNRKYKDDEDGTINRYRKWYRREKYMTTFLREEGVPPDNNVVERVAKKIMCVRVDGGGNRSLKGMKANSRLLTIMGSRTNSWDQAKLWSMEMIHNQTMIMHESVGKLEIVNVTIGHNSLDPTSLSENPIMCTDWVRGDSFFDHIVRSTSGYG